MSQLELPSPTAPPPLTEENYDRFLRTALEARKPGAYNAILSSAQSRMRAAARANAPQLSAAPADTSPTDDAAPAGAAPAGAAPAGAAPASANLDVAATPASAAPVGVVASGIPHGLDGVGEGKINKCSEEQLLACLAEHGLEPPSVDVQDKSLYAKKLLFKTCGPMRASQPYPNPHIDVLSLCNHV